MNSLFQALAVCGLATVVFSSSAAADSYRHVDQVAVQVERQAKQLVRESRHYRHTPEYSHLVADAREMAALAEHIHELAHSHGSLAHLESDVAELDAQFHHFESLIAQIERRAGHGHGRGHGYSHGHGHVHGNTADVRELLHAIEDNIHHLQADLRSLRTPRHSVRPLPYPPQPYRSARPLLESAPTPRWDAGNSRPYSRGRGITFGGGSSQFTIRF